MTDRKGCGKSRPGLVAVLLPVLVLTCCLGIPGAAKRENVAVSEEGQEMTAAKAEAARTKIKTEAETKAETKTETKTETQAETQEDGAVETKRAPQVAITFDDGPHPVYTARLLDGLKERGVSATFFVLGQKIEGNESLLERMSREGHLIGNHTFHHVKLDSLQHEAAVEEIRKTSDLIEAVTGRGTEFIRPPFGIWDKSLEYDVAMLPALWDVDTLDWTTKNVPVTVGRAVEHTADQDIILFHDCYDSSVEAALQAVDLLLEQGYEFVTVDRIILAP